jgi:hypothetical protein
VFGFPNGTTIARSDIQRDAYRRSLFLDTTPGSSRTRPAASGWMAWSGCRVRADRRDRD